MNCPSIICLNDLIFHTKQENLQQSHSIDEVHEEHTIKKEMEEELGEVKKQNET